MIKKNGLLLTMHCSGPATALVETGLKYHALKCGSSCHYRIRDDCPTEERQGQAVVAHRPACIHKMSRNKMKVKTSASGGARTTTDGPALCATACLPELYANEKGCEAER